MSSPTEQKPSCRAKTSRTHLLHSRAHLLHSRNFPNLSNLLSDVPEPYPNRTHPFDWEPTFHYRTHLRWQPTPILSDCRTHSINPFPKRNLPNPSEPHFHIQLYKSPTPYLQAQLVLPSSLQLGPWLCKSKLLHRRRGFMIFSSSLRPVILIFRSPIFGNLWYSDLQSTAIYVVLRPLICGYLLDCSPICCTTLLCSSSIQSRTSATRYILRRSTVSIALFQIGQALISSLDSLIQYNSRLLEHLR